MGFEFRPLDEGDVGRLEGVVDREVVLTMALTAHDHYRGTARWVLVDLRDLDVETAAAEVADVGLVRRIDQAAREVVRGRVRDLHIGFVCTEATYQSVVVPILMALDEVEASRLGLDTRFDRFDTLIDGFAWDAVSGVAEIPDWAHALDRPHRR